MSLPKGYETVDDLWQEAHDHVANALWCLGHLHPDRPGPDAVKELADAIQKTDLEGIVHGAGDWDL